MTGCFSCGVEATLVGEQRELRIGDRSAVVEHEFFRCPNCGEEFFLPEQMAAAQRQASTAIRAAEGLLLPEEISAIRDQLGLSQRDFERLLGVGAKTVARWERGTVFQNKSTDALLLLIRQFPEAAQFLAERSGVQLRAEADWPRGVLVDYWYTPTMQLGEATSYWRSIRSAVLCFQGDWSYPVVFSIGSHLPVHMRVEAQQEKTEVPFDVVNRVRHAIGI